MVWLAAALALSAPPREGPGLRSRALIICPHDQPLVRLHGQRREGWRRPPFPGAAARGPWTTVQGPQSALERILRLALGRVEVARGYSLSRTYLAKCTSSQKHTNGPPRAGRSARRGCLWPVRGSLVADRVGRVCAAGDPLDPAKANGRPREQQAGRCCRWTTPIHRSSAARTRPTAVRAYVDASGIGRRCGQRSRGRELAPYGVGARRSRMRTASIRFSRTDSTRIE
jgi:hypothetical protein